MSIKLIATDLDGTLMSTDHMTITDFTLSTLKKAHEKGIKIAIATGRPLSLIGNVVEQIPFADYVIYSNGACVLDRESNKLIYSNLIDNKRALEIIKYLLTKEVFFEIYLDGKSHYPTGREKYFNAKPFPGGFVEEVKNSMHPHENLIDFVGERSVEKITLYSIKSRDFPAFVNKFKSMNLFIASSFKDNLELTEKTANKGVALEGLSKKTGIKASEIMSFGDAENDAEMLKFADYSFAMANGDEKAKDSAKFLARSNAEDGLALAVIQYALEADRNLKF